MTLSEECRRSAPAMAGVRDFRRLAVVGSQWQHEGAWIQSGSARCTVTRLQGTLPRYRAVRADGSTYADARLDLPPEDYLAFHGGDTMHVLSDPADPTSVVTTWRYLGRATRPVHQPPVAMAAVRACRVDRLKPGDVVFGPAALYDGRAPGYTVVTVTGDGSPVTVHTREGWPVRYAPWVKLAVVPAGDAGRCEPVGTLPAVGQARVYLGVNEAGWLNRPELAGIPKCISRGRLAKAKRLQRSLSLLLIDSGGFSELKHHGRWRFTAAEYIAQLRVMVAQLGRDSVVAIAPQDWMCETVVIEGGRTKDGTFVGTRQFIDPDGKMTLDEVVYEHQRRTVANFVELRRLAPDLPIFPVLQGQTGKQYLRHMAMYAAAGIRFVEEPLVGLGSVCRRQGTRETAELVRMLAAYGLRLHGFGVGVKGLALYGRSVASVDSNSWSFNGRRAVGRCPHGVVKWEQNCPVKARQWWDNAIALLTGRPKPIHAPAGRPVYSQLRLFDAA